MTLLEAIVILVIFAIIITVLGAVSEHGKDLMRKEVKCLTTGTWQIKSIDSQPIIGGDGWDKPATIERVGGQESRTIILSTEDRRLLKVGDQIKFVPTNVSPCYRIERVN